MLSAVRNGIKSPFFVVLFVLLIASFALWGVNDVFQSPGDNVAVVGGERVTVFDLQREFDGAINRAREDNPGITQEQARAEGLGDQALNQLILNAMLRSQARSLGIAASDQAIRQEIRDFEVFTDPLDGGFDREAYRRFLAQTNQRERQFETDVRNNLVLQQLTSSLFEGITYPEAYRELLNRYVGEVRDLEALVIPASAADELPDPTDEQLQATIDGNPQFFTAPERRGITLVRLRIEDYLMNVAVNESDIVEQYEFDLESGAIGTPATRTYVQIAVANEADANAAAELLANGEDADLVAAELGGNTPSRFEERQAFQVPDDTVRDTLFEAAAGDSLSVQTEFGTWFAILVEAAEEESIPTLENQRAQIRDELARAAAEDALYTDLGAYEEARANGLSIEEAAFAAGLVIEVFQTVDQQGRSEDGNFAFGFFTEPDILSTAFEQPPLVDTNLLDYGDGNFFALRVDVIEDSRLRSLEEAREDAETVWRLQEIDAQLEDIAENVLTLLDEGQTLESIRDANPAFRIEQASLRRDENSGTFSRDVVNLAFSLDVGDVESTHSGVGRSHLVLRVNAARDGEVQNPEILAQLNEFLDQGYRSDIDSSLVTALYREFDFDGSDINVRNRDQALGLIDPTQIQ
ncbi:SurA N-terminal domain-containing protein [Hyphobacterium sp.]|uniref:SurA N-terminal domain-containing protein n=1 Tax=Hyphobacterium sp. TaxID=2004662 RepID=UPI003BAD5DBE